MGEIQVKNQQVQLDALAGLTERIAFDVDFNFIGLVQVLPLQFKWVGVAAFIIVNVLANTLTLAGVAAFVGGIAGLTVSDDLLAIAGAFQKALAGDATALRELERTSDLVAQLVDTPLPEEAFRAILERSNQIQARIDSAAAAALLVDGHLTEGITALRSLVEKIIP